MRVSPTATVLATLCGVLLVWQTGAGAQDLGAAKGRIMERGQVDLQQLTRQADLVVRGYVSSKAPKWIGRVIYTEYHIAVLETLKGAARSDVMVALVGGAQGNVRLTVPGAPDLPLGSQLLFFGAPLDGTTFAPLGMFDGVQPIRWLGSSATISPRGQPEELETALREIRSVSRRP